MAKLRYGCKLAPETTKPSVIPNRKTQVNKFGIERRKYDEDDALIPLPRGYALSAPYMVKNHYGENSEHGFYTRTGMKFDLPKEREKVHITPTIIRSSPTKKAATGNRFWYLR